MLLILGAPSCSDGADYRVPFRGERRAVASELLIARRQHKWQRSSFCCCRFLSAPPLTSETFGTTLPLPGGAIWRSDNEEIRVELCFSQRFGHRRLCGDDCHDKSSRQELDFHQLLQAGCFDPKQSKIGDVDDVLVDESGKITGLVIGVGGFLGAGEKDVIVPFGSVKTAKKNDKWWLTLDETKDDLKQAPGFKYDKASPRGCPTKNDGRKPRSHRGFAPTRMR